MKKNFLKHLISLFVICILSTIVASGCKYSLEVEDGAWDEAGRCVLEGHDCRRIIIEAQKTSTKQS